MTRLIICNTFYQFITALHMSKTLFKEDACDLIITDQSNDSSKLYNNLKKNKVPAFRHIAYIRTKEFCKKKNGVFFLNDIFNTLCGNSPLEDMNSIFYDEVLTYNYDYFLVKIYGDLKKINPNLVYSKFEEGIFSYNLIMNYNRMNILLCIRKIMKLPVPKENAFYCFFPEAYEGNLIAKRIPPIIDDVLEVKEILEIGFGIDKAKFSNQYSEKYIFFTSVYDFEGESPIGEFEAICEIAKLVGKENLLIKKHPRDSRMIFEEHGFKVDSNSSIPWEALQFEINLNGKTLLTVNSGAVISTSLLFGSNVKSVYVYNICQYESNSLAVASIKNIDSLIKSDFFKDRVPNVYKIDKVEDLVNK